MALLVADAARRLRTTPTTVRRWSSEFADVLHPRARGGNNSVRRFDGHDMQVLDRASELLGRTGATYAQVKTTLKEEFAGSQSEDEPKPRRLEPITALPRAPEPAPVPAPVQRIAPDPPKQAEDKPSLEELVAAAVTAATRGQSIQIAGLNDTVDALSREVRELKNRIVALEDLALGGRRGRWPFGG